MIRVSHAIARGMVARGRGHIVNLGSTAGLRVYRSGSVYNASKFAVRAFTEGLRMDYADTDLRITEILPGLTRTGFAAARLHGDRQRGEDYYARFPGTIAAADVARAVIFALEQPPGRHHRAARDRADPRGLRGPRGRRRCVRMAFDLRRQDAYFGCLPAPRRAIGARAGRCGNRQAETHSGVARPRQPAADAAGHRRGGLRHAARALGRVARQALSARRDLGRQRASTSPCSRPTRPRSSCACSIASGRRELERIALPEYTDEVWHGYLPDVAARPALRLSRARPLRAAQRPSLQSEQAADRPLCPGRCAAR